MILVIGGAYQGKLAYGLQTAGIGQVLRGCYADGRQDDFEEAYRRPVIYGMHQYLRRLLLEKQDGLEFIDRLMACNSDALVIMDEVGCGIVPTDPKEREYRELVGLAGQKMAAGALEVHRVFCGIGTRIK